MLGALPALGLLGTSIFDGGGMSAGLGLLGGMAGGLIGSNTPHPGYNVEGTAPYVGFNTFGQDYPVGAQGMLQGYLGQGGGMHGGVGLAFGTQAGQGYSYGSNGASYFQGQGSNAWAGSFGGGFGTTGYGGYGASQPGGGWYDARNSITAGPPAGSLSQYQGVYANNFGGSLGGNGAFHLGANSFNLSDPYGLNVGGNFFHQGATSAGISTGPDGFGAVGLFTGYDIGWGGLNATQQTPQYQQPSYGYGGGGGYGQAGYPATGGGYGYVGAGGSAGFGGGQGGYGGGGYGGYGYAPPTGYGFTPSGMMGGYSGGGGGFSSFGGGYFG